MNTWEELAEGKGMGGNVYACMYTHIYYFDRQSYYIALADLELKFRELPAFFSVMGLKVCATMYG